jgi:fatty acid desaturase
MSRFLAREAAALACGDPRRRRIWLCHAACCVPVVVWLSAFCGMGLGRYLLLFVYPGTALLMLRSLPEHRAADEPAGRTAIVENAPLLGPLFLFNNLHAVHHRHPALPWYKLPACYHAGRDGFLRDNGGLVYDGYLDVVRRFLLKPHDVPVHPRGRAPLGRARQDRPKPA